jgi:hypothetical protein
LINKHQYRVSSDVDKTGKKVIGRDVLSCTFAGNATCYVTLGLKGGDLRGHFTEVENGAISGKITGGDGTFAGAKGSIVGQDHGGGKATIALTYKS